MTRTPAAIHVLIVDDSPSDVEIIQRMLRLTDDTVFDVQTAGNLADGLNLLAHGGIDVVLLDLSLPDSHGLSTFQQVHACTPDVATIVLSGLDDATVAMNAVREGAEEYLVKGQFEGTVLARSVRYAHERSKSRQELRESEALYHSLVESLPLNLFRKDTESRFLFANQGFCDDIGMSMAELLGKTDFDLFPHEIAAKYIRDDRRVIETGEIFEDVEQHPETDGSTIYVQVMKSPVRDSKGAIIGVQGMFWDVTARRRAEEQLKTAKEAAEQASRAKSQFLANMSHEVRTPLNAVLGMTEWLLDTRLTDEQHEYLTIVHQSGESLLILLNDILDFSKIEAGRLDLESAPFNVRETLDVMMKLLAVRAQHQQIELVCRVEPSVPRCLVGDGFRLRQVLINLVGNAIKFTTQGEVLLDVRCDDRADDVAQLRFTVTDTGIGISKEKLEAIFEAFEQADGSTTRKYGGTGLGLTISAHLVALMGGKLQVKSQPGRGSNFHFSLDMKIADDGSRATGGSSLDPLADMHAVGSRTTYAPQPIEQLRVGSLRILLAEDSLINQKLTIGLLTRHFHHVTAVENGKAALDALERQSFDLVVMDVQMPEMDGLQATARIRAREKETGGHLPIIAITAHAMEGDRERCLAAGMDGYISKPVRARELYAVIAEATGHEAHFSSREFSQVVEGTSTGAIDWSTALDATAGDLELLRQVAQAFLDDYASLLLDLKQAIEGGNGERWNRAAHTLKGALRHFGAASAVARAGELEKMGQDNRDCIRGSKSFAELEREIQCVVNELQDFVTKNRLMIQG